MSMEPKKAMRAHFGWNIALEEACLVVERVMTEWGNRDSLSDMLDEITAEILALREAT